MDFDIQTQITKVNHIKPFEVKSSINIMKPSLRSIIESIYELPEHERRVLVYRKITSPIPFFPTRHRYNIETVGTVRFPGRWFTEYISIPSLLKEEYKVNTDSIREAQQLKTELKYVLHKFIRNLDKKNKLI